jgi:hypothetical protein
MDMIERLEQRAPFVGERYTGALSDPPSVLIRRP